MTWISEWVRTIGVLVILISMVELIMPHKKYRKYIKLILGLIFILVLMEPLAELVTGKEVFSSTLLDSQIELEQKSLQSQLEYYNAKQQDVIKAQYDDLLMQQIEHILSGSGYQVIKGNVATKEDEKKQLGVIDKITLSVKEKSEDEKSYKIEKVVIEDIRIRDQEPVQKTNKHIIMENEVKRVLSEFYHIDKEKIRVYAVVEDQNE